MRKVSKIMMITVSVLLSLVLITTSVLSGTLAKYTTNGMGSSKARVAKWGITVDSSSALADAYYKDGALVVSSTEDISGVIAPGTKGSLVWFHVSGNPEVKFNINFTGSINIGDGYRASSGIIREEDGSAVEYFPIPIYCVVYNVVSKDANGNLVLERADTLKNDLGYNVNTSSCVQRIDYKGTHNFFDDDAWEDLDRMESVLNGESEDFTYRHLNNVFDSSNNPANVAIDRVYSIEWCWPYSSESDYPSKGTGTSGQYQSAYLDTQLGEAIRANSNNDLFKIQLDMSVVITQAK